MQMKQIYSQIKVLAVFYQIKEINYNYGKGCTLGSINC